MPVPMPPIMTVAGPVLDCSAMPRVGAYASDVKYSVILPIKMPVRSPTIIEPQLPSQFSRPSK